jgi:biotin carboxyl carrier protein
MAEYTVSARGHTHHVRVSEDGAGLRVSLDGETVAVRLEPLVGRTHFRLTAGEVTRATVIRRSAVDVVVTLDDEQYRLRIEPAVPIARRAAAVTSGVEEVKAPMPGLVVAVEVAEGDVVEQGRPVVVMEAMKMQSELRAALGGRVTAVHVTPGQEVMRGAVLVTMAAPGTGTREQGAGEKESPKRRGARRKRARPRG